MVLSLDAENDRLRAVIGTFKDMVFGSRSEKLTAVIADQLALDLADLATDVTLPAAANDDHVPSKPAGATGKPRKKAQRNIGALPKHLPRCEQVIEPETMACPCCQGRLHKIGQDVSEVLDVIPAILRVLRMIRPKYGCRGCEGAVVQAKALPRLIENSMASTALVTHVVVSKFAWFSTLYRQVQILAGHGVHLDRSTLAGWVKRTAWWAPRKIASSANLCEFELLQRDFAGVGTMGQFGFFDADRRLAAITAKGDPLEMIDRVVPFESFRSEIEAAVLTPVSEKKSSAGRKPIDVVVMFRMLVLQSLYNLSDEQVEYQVRDRLSFTRFLRLGIEDGIPDGTTLWLFRETLAKAGLIEELFERFGQHLETKGYIARGGQMVDATIVPVPKQRNSRDENDDVKAGKTPGAWERKPAKNRQKDKDARWTKKHGKSFYGYKNHVNADAKHKLIRQYDVTDASVHDSRKFDGLLNQANTSADVYADSAYRSAQTEAKLSLRGLRSRIYHRANRNHPLSQAQANANRQKSKVRARIEHVFGAQQNSPGGRIVRTIGIARAKAKIGLQNLAYNIRRLVTLERMASA